MSSDQLIVESPANGSGPINDLPFECLYWILSWLSFDEIHKCMTVSKQWEQAADHALTFHNKLYMSPHGGLRLYHDSDGKIYHSELDCWKPFPILSKCLTYKDTATREKIFSKALRMDKMQVLCCWDESYAYHLVTAADFDRIFKPVVLQNARYLHTLNIDAPITNGISLSNLRVLRCAGFTGSFTETVGKSFSSLRVLMIEKDIRHNESSLTLVLPDVAIPSLEELHLSDYQEDEADVREFLLRNRETIRIIVMVQALPHFDSGETSYDKLTSVDGVT